MSYKFLRLSSLYFLFVYFSDKKNSNALSLSPLILSGSSLMLNPSTEIFHFIYSIVQFQDFCLVL